MANSHCLLSNKRHLGAIWVAAYCFKKLKKFQVTATDISSSVDKILQDEMDVVTYRILAYLLLGVVRIYSKKVEYLFDDCNEILTEIKKFVVDVKDKAQMKTIQASFGDITLPESFELDAFDLDIVEGFDGGNLVSPKEITLQENTPGNESSKPYFLDKHHYEDGGVFNDKFYHDDLLAEGPRTSHAQIVFEKLQDSNYVGEKLMDLSASHVAGKESPDLVECSKNNHYHGEQLIMSVVVDSEHGIYPEWGLEKHKRFSEEVNEMMETCPRLEIEPSYIAKSFYEHQTDETGIVPLESEKFHSVGEENDFSCLNRSIEKLRDNTCPAEECMDLDQSCSAKEESPNLGRIVNKEYYHIDEEQLKSVDTMSGKRELNNTTPRQKLSISPVETPIFKFIDASEKITPDFMAVTTPATKECARTSRKRKCIIDDFVILPNKIIKRSIHDASDLVSKRKKAPHNAFAVWKASQISNRFNGFVEPAMSCISFELRSLFYDSRQKILKSVGTVNSSLKLDEDDYPSDAANFSLETHTEIVNSPQKLDTTETPNNQILATLETVEVLENSGELEPSNLDCCEPLAIAPETPVRQSSSFRPFQSPLERVYKEPYMRKDGELDFSLLDEELGLCKGDEQEADGWSGRTRLVARHLHQNFIDQKQQRMDEVIELFQLLEGSTRKASARLFYEILVLKSKECMDVKQDHAYGDIVLLKLPKWEQIFGTLSM